MNILLKNGEIWDGLASKTIPKEILVKDGIISQIDDNIKVDKDVEIIDLKGHTITPGLIDLHTHITIFPSIFGSTPKNPAAIAFSALPVLKQLLGNGFTTLRDLGTTGNDWYTLDIRDAIENGTILGPRLLVAPHLLSARGGHGDGYALLGSQYKAPYPSFSSLEVAAADGQDEIRTRVRQEIRAGADWVKFAGSGGFSTPSDDPARPTYAQDEMDMLVSTAEDLGRHVATHCVSDEGVRRATKAGVRTVEHANLASKETFQMMADKGTYLVPTFYTMLEDAYMVDDDKYWKGQPTFKRAKYVKYAKDLINASQNVAENDEIKVAFGTDAGMFDHVQNINEFDYMVNKVGLKPLRALKAATSVAAEVLEMDNIGSLKVGNIADIIAMPKNPLDDISAIKDVDFVMKEGSVFKNEPEKATSSKK